MQQGETGPGQTCEDRLVRTTIGTIPDDSLISAVKKYVCLFGTVHDLVSLIHIEMCITPLK